MNILELKNLSVSFKSRKSLTTLLKKNNLDAVIDNSFAIKDNSTYGIVGESGSGKTTLAKTILGLLTTPNGNLRFNKKNLLELQDNT